MKTEFMGMSDVAIFKVGMSQSVAFHCKNLSIQWYSDIT